MSTVGVASGSPIPIGLVDFEKTPSLARGPSVFSQAGKEADIGVPNIATISGGVVLGNATNLPALSYATPPNVYATGSRTVNGVFLGADPSLQASLSIAIDPSFTAQEVGFTLLNGNTIPATYSATAYNGATVLGTLSRTIPSNANNGFSIYDFKFPTITRVIITPDTVAQGFDYAIDSIALNQSVQDAVPEPSAGAVLLIGAGGLLATGRKRRAS